MSRRGHRGGVGRSRRHKRQEAWEATRPPDSRDRHESRIVWSKDPVSEADHYQASHEPGYLEALAAEARRRNAESYRGGWR